MFLFLLCQISKYLIYLLTTKLRMGNIHALENIELELKDGESVGIAGESACGKSTLGLTIIKMLQGGKIISGKILFNGKSILGYV